VQRHEWPEPPSCTQRTKIAWASGAPEQQQLWPIASAGVCSPLREENAAFQVAAGDPVVYHEVAKVCRSASRPGPGRPWGTQAGRTSHKNETSRFGASHPRTVQTIPGLPGARPRAIVMRCIGRSETRLSDEIHGW